MKYRQLVSNTTPIFVQFCLEDELEKLGIDEDYYTPSLPHESLICGPSEINEEFPTCIKNGANISVPFSKAKHRRSKKRNSKWRKLQFDNGKGLFDLAGSGIRMKVNQPGETEVQKGKEEDFNCESRDCFVSEGFESFERSKHFPFYSDKPCKNGCGKFHRVCEVVENYYANLESQKILNMDQKWENVVLGNRNDLYNSDFPALNNNSKANQLEPVKSDLLKRKSHSQEHSFFQYCLDKMEENPTSDVESNSSEKENIIEGESMVVEPPMMIKPESDFIQSTHIPVISIIEEAASFPPIYAEAASFLVASNPAILNESDVERQRELLAYYRGFIGHPDIRVAEYDGNSRLENIWKDNDYTEQESSVPPIQHYMFNQDHQIWAPSKLDTMVFSYPEGNSEVQSSESSTSEEQSSECSTSEEQSSTSEEFPVVKSRSSSEHSFHGSSVLGLDDGSMENLSCGANEEDFLDPAEILKGKKLITTHNFVGAERSVSGPLMPKDVTYFENTIKEPGVYTLWGEENLDGKNETNGVWSRADKIATFYEKNYGKVDSMSCAFEAETKKTFNHSEGSRFKKFDGALSGQSLSFNHNSVSSSSKRSFMLKKDDEEEENLLTSESSHFAPIDPDTDDSFAYNMEYTSATEIKIKKNHCTTAAANNEDINKDQRKKSEDLSAPLRVEDLEACASDDEDSGLEKVKILQAGFRSQTAVDRSNNTTPLSSVPFFIGFEMKTLVYGKPKSVRSTPPAVEHHSVEYTVSANNPCWQYAKRLFERAGLSTGNNSNNEGSDSLFSKGNWSTSDGSDETSRLGQREAAFDSLVYPSIDIVNDSNDAATKVEDNDNSGHAQAQYEENQNNDNEDVETDAVVSNKLSENFGMLCSLKDGVDPDTFLNYKISALTDSASSPRTCDDATLAYYEALIGNDAELPAIPTNNVLYSSELEDEWQRLSPPFDNQLPCKTKHNNLGDEWHSSLHQRPCSFYLEGNCHRFNCKFSHNLARITCRFWVEGTCFKGATCPFLHGYVSDEDFSSLPLSPFLEEKSKPLSSPMAPKWNFKLESEKDFPSLSASSLRDTDSHRPSLSSTSDMIGISKKLGNSSRREPGIGRIIRSKKSKKCFSNHLPISSSSRNEVSLSSRGKNQDGLASIKNLSATIRHELALKI